MRRRASICLPLLAFAPRVAVATEASGLVLQSKGTLPLILTVPHDGDEAIGAVPVRRKGALLRDAGTSDLAQRTASALEARTGRRPCLVVARFSRKYLDANRASEDAMESQDALPAYRAYHDQISAWVAELKGLFPNGALLLDIHGQSQDPGTTFRGTRAGLTVQALLGRFGPAALHGERSITGVLAAKGYAVNPGAGADSMREDPRFAGGYTVFRYGSHRADGIDAIQLEFGRHHRANAHLAADLAEALAVFLTRYGYLPQ